MITILMASYNGERHIGEQIESILRQTVQEFRLIIQDDGSSDQTFTIAGTYADKYPEKIICMQNEFPTGSAKGNFFLMLRRLKDAIGNMQNPDRAARDLQNVFSGEKQPDYIIFADQDDVWKADKLEKLQKRMRRMEERFGKATPLLVYSDLEVVDENLQTIHPSMQRMMGHGIGGKRLRELLVENDVTGNSLMMNAALLGIFFEPLNAPMHDWYLALLARVYGEIEFLDENLTLYRQHGFNSLGAKKTGFLQAVRGKLCRTAEENEAIQNHYREMFAQAESILKFSGRIEKILEANAIQKTDSANAIRGANSANAIDKADGIRKPVKKTEKTLERRYRILKEFLSLQGRSRLGKILCIFRNRFFKSRFMMTLGQLFSI